MKQNKIKKFSLLASLAVLTVGSVQGAVTAGSLVLFFQTRGVQGAGNGVYVNLGDAATLFRGPATGPDAGQQRLNFINIGSTLDSAFGTGWASDPDIYAGLAGVYSNIQDPTVVDGDQYRTIYASRARPSVGTVGEAEAALYNLDSKGGLTTSATNMLALASNFATLLGSADQGVVADTTIRTQNPFKLSGGQDTAFGQFDTGVQQKGSASAFGVFGSAGEVEFALDLQRLVPDGTVEPGEVAGPRRRGTFEGTVTIATNGDVSFVTVPEPSGTLALGILGTVAGLSYRRRRNA